MHATKSVNVCIKKRSHVHVSLILCIVDVAMREFASTAAVSYLGCQSHALRPADVIDVPKHVSADATATKISAI